MNHQLLKYGILNSNNVHISTVESGLKCNCVCPCCGTKLVAKKGKLGSPQEHFAHKNKEQCEFAYETSIHFEAKRFLKIERRIGLPFRKLFSDADILSDIFQPKSRQDIGTVENRFYELSDIKSEKRLHDFVPDVQATIHGRPILIEIAVTNKVKALKKEKIEKIGIPTLEIDFSRLTRDISEEDFRLNLFHNTRNKRWIYNPKDDAVIEQAILLRSKIEQLIAPYLESLQILEKGQSKSIHNCPSPFNNRRKIGIEECGKCIYRVFLFENNVVCAAKNYLIIKAIIESEVKKADPS